MSAGGEEQSASPMDDVICDNNVLMSEKGLADFCKAPDDIMSLAARAKVRKRVIERLEQIEKCISHSDAALLVAVKLHLSLAYNAYAVEHDDSAGPDAYIVFAQKSHDKMMETRDAVPSTFTQQMSICSMTNIARAKCHIAASKNSRLTSNEKEALLAETVRFLLDAETECLAFDGPEKEYYLAWIYRSLAQYHSIQATREAALLSEEYLIKALREAKNDTDGRTERNTTWIMRDLGNICERLEKWHEAHKWHYGALARDCELYDARDPETSEHCNFLANIERVYSREPSPDAIQDIREIHSVSAKKYGKDDALTQALVSFLETNSSQ